MIPAGTRSADSEKDRPMNKTAETIAASLDRGTDVAVATIVEKTGSAPRTIGAKMVVFPDGAAKGTIGGGAMEAQVVKRAVEDLAAGRTELVACDLTATDAASMGMICGGSVTVLIDTVPAHAENVALFSRWAAALNKKEDIWLLTVFLPPSDAAGRVGHLLARRDGIIAGDRSFLGEDEASVLEKCCRKGPLHQVEAAGRVIIAEPAVIPHRLHIFGAGHVGVATAALAAQVGFDVCVADDRPEFAEATRFSGGIHTRIIEDFENAFSDIQVGDTDFVVIVTRGHLHDKTVLAQTLKTPATYVGMIGSKKKRDAIYAALAAEGVGQKETGRVHCPIGLAIGAQTPEEIAVSIVAELIQHRIGMP